MKHHFRTDIIHPPALDKTKISGPPAALMDIFFQHRIFSDDAREVVYREAEDAFRNKLDDANGIIGIRQGEFWGQWIISAVRVAEYSGNIGLREFIRHGVHSLLKEQEPDGSAHTMIGSRSIPLPVSTQLLRSKKMSARCSMDHCFWPVPNISVIRKRRCSIPSPFSLVAPPAAWRHANDRK